MSFLVELDTLPDWGVLAKIIEEQYSISPENVNLSFLNDGHVICIANEQELQRFYEHQSSNKVKFVVQDRQTLTLFCWVLNVSDDPLHIDIGKCKTVGHLKKAIKKEKEHTFGGIDADAFSLWKVGEIPVRVNVI